MDAKNFCIRPLFLFMYMLPFKIILRNILVFLRGSNGITMIDEMQIYLLYFIFHSSLLWLREEMYLIVMKIHVLLMQNIFSFIFELKCDITWRFS